MIARGLVLAIRTTDNGRGFDVDDVLTADTGVGMSSMRMRIERMVGNCGSSPAPAKRC